MLHALHKLFCLSATQSNATLPVLQMARQRSAPAALSIPADIPIITPPVTPNSPQKSDFWGSPPRKSPTHRNPRKKPTRGNLAPASRLGMKHVASEPQLMALGSTDFEGSAKDVVRPLTLTAHTVPALQTLPDETPPLVSALNSPRDQPQTAPASHSSASSVSHVTVPSRPNSISGSRGMLSPLGQSPPTPKPLDDSTAEAIARAVHTDDASLLNSVLPSLKSSMMSTTSLSTIAESNSSPECSAQDLAALDQVAERLIELDNTRLASESSQSQLGEDAERSNSGVKPLLKTQSGGAFQVSASSSSLSMDQQASEAQLTQPAEIPHSESVPAELPQTAASDSAGPASEASDAPPSFVAPLFTHFPMQRKVSDPSQEAPTAASDADLHRTSGASSGSFEGFEAARQQAASEILHRHSVDSDSAHTSASSSDASTPAFPKCASGRHNSPFIAQKQRDALEPQQAQQAQQQQDYQLQQQQGQGVEQNPGHLVLHRDLDGPFVPLDAVLTSGGPSRGGGGGGGSSQAPRASLELGRASPR